MTRTELLALFERYLKRNDLTDLYGDFIEMAEARINAVMRLSEMEKRSTSTPTAAHWSLPSDFLELRHIQAAENTASYPIEYITPEQADDKRRIMDSTGKYRFYTLVDNSIEIIPHPGATTTTEIEIFYYAKVDALVDTTDTNDIVTNYPNLYIYAMMGEAALYREAGQQADMWLGTFDSYAAQLNQRASAARFSGNSMQMRAV